MSQSEPLQIGNMADFERESAIWTPDQVKMILDAMPAGQPWLFGLLLWWTALRQAEALNLEWWDLQFAGAQPSVTVRKKRIKRACPMKLGRDVSRHNELDNWRNTHKYESVMAIIWLLLTISESDPGLWDRLKRGEIMVDRPEAFSQQRGRGFHGPTLDQPAPSADRAPSLERRGQERRRIKTKPAQKMGH